MSEISFVVDKEVIPIDSIELYSDGTPRIKTERFAELRNAHTMILKPRSLNTFVAAMFLADSINQSGGWLRNLVLPFIPGARQDRINPTGDVLFTAKSVADMINARQFSRVLVLDPHSPVSVSLIDNASVYPLLEVFKGFWAGWTGIIAPDKGAKDRAEQVAPILWLDVTYATKVRDVSTGHLSGFDVTVQRGGHYLVVDDICDGGGTFVGLGQKIRNQGAYATLYVSHGIFSKGTEELKKYYEDIYTTDSRDFHERNDVKIIPVIERMTSYVRTSV